MLFDRWKHADASMSVATGVGRRPVGAAAARLCRSSPCCNPVDRGDILLGVFPLIGLSALLVFDAVVVRRRFDRYV
jgi:hypothetical protein